MKGNHCWNYIVLFNIENLVRHLRGGCKIEWNFILKIDKLTSMVIQSMCNIIREQM